MEDAAPAPSIPPPPQKGGGRSSKALTARRREQVVALLVAGCTYEQAAKEVGITTNAAWELAGKALDEAIARREADGSEKLRQLHFQRHQGLILTHWARRADPRSAAVVQTSLKETERLCGIAMNEITVRNIDGNTPAPTLDTSTLSIEDKLKLRELLMRAASTPTTVDVESLPVAGASKKNGHGSNGNGTHALELPVGDGEDA